MNRTSSLSTSIPNELLSLDAMVERLRELVIESSWNSRNISHNIFSIHHQSFRDATKNQANSLKSMWTTGLKVLDVICKTDLSEILKGKISESTASLLKSALSVGSIAVSASLHATEMTQQAYRQEQSSRGEISREGFGQAQKKKSEADDSLSRTIQIFAGIKDLQRSTITAMHRSS